MEKAPLITVIISQNKGIVNRKHKIASETNGADVDICRFLAGMV